MGSEDYATEYTKEHLEKEVSMESILAEVRLETVLQSLDTYGWDKVLEVGCGLNPVFPHVDSSVRCTVVEPEAAFVEHARGLAQDQKGVRIVHGRLAEMTDQLDESDFVIASSVLHEVPDPLRLLDGILKLTASDGTVHINVPNVYSFHRLLAKEMGLIETIYEQSEKEARFDRHTHYDMEKLQNQVERAGFTIRDSGTYFVKPFTGEQIEAMIGEALVDESVIEGLVGMSKYLPEMGCEMFVDATPTG